jgi:hypothetical protein
VLASPREPEESAPAMEAMASATAAAPREVFTTRLPSTQPPARRPGCWTEPVNSKRSRGFKVKAKNRARRAQTPPSEVSGRPAGPFPVGGTRHRGRLAVDRPCARRERRHWGHGAARGLARLRRRAPSSHAGLRLLLFPDRRRRPRRAPCRLPDARRLPGTRRPRAADARMQDDLRGRVRLARGGASGVIGLTGRRPELGCLGPEPYLFSDVFEVQ